MPRYEPNLTNTQAGIILLPKGDFDFKVNEVKTFSRISVDQQTQLQRDVFGIQYNLEVVSGSEASFIGKTVPVQLYMHTEASLGINKRFIMAALGFAIYDESSFNEKYADADWSFDTEEGEVGDIWRSVVGTRVNAATDIVPNKRNPNQQNQQFNWRPI